ncbi:MAG TPA: hypothetical protein VK157_03340 [Phycisphaerales bacterium]|nr:hypothetical protein [Phycisphaerales bacterium]
MSVDRMAAAKLREMPREAGSARKADSSGKGPKGVPAAGHGQGTMKAEPREGWGDKSAVHGCRHELREIAPTKLKQSCRDQTNRTYEKQGEPDEARLAS